MRPDTAFLIGLGLGIVFGLVGQYSAYWNGVEDGARAAQKPRDPLYRRARKKLMDRGIL